MPLSDSLAFLTEDLPGIGGVIKLRPEDFLVEEQPLYRTCGRGEHVYLFIEKTSLTTTDIVRDLARAFRVGRNDIGYAGLKDKHAIVRQHFSVWLPDRDDESQCIERLADRRLLKVLWSDRHTNKLRRGHHGGNRFVIRIRNVQATDAIKAKLIVDRLFAQGVPNFVGDQRFGYRQHNHILGRLLLCGEYQALLDEMLGRPIDADPQNMRLARTAYDRRDYQEALKHWPKHLRFDRQALDALRQGHDARHAVMAIYRTQREFLVSALQSAMFNSVLDRRLREGKLTQLVPGDLAWKHDNRSVFAVDQETADKENTPAGRVPSLEVSPSGPMWGVNMTRAAGEPGEVEQQVMDVFGVRPEHLAGVGDVHAEGSRRAMRIALRDPEVSGGSDEHGPYVKLAFEMPRGAFATIALREIMKDTKAAKPQTPPVVQPPTVFITAKHPPKPAPRTT
jgi:tRNA pseudouridine13 synthase